MDTSLVHFAAKLFVFSGVVLLCSSSSSSSGGSSKINSVVDPLAEQQQQQAFRVTPSDIEARVGEEVVMRCEVEHLAGQVQWTKDGFALGFANDIVGFPRFSLNQNHSRGVYNLRITNASLEDTASYQCQAGPAKHNRPIRAGAKLTVLGSMKIHHGTHRRN